MPPWTVQTCRRACPALVEWILIWQALGLASFNSAAYGTWRAGPTDDVTARQGRALLSMRLLLGFHGVCATLTLCVQGTCGLVGAGEMVPTWKEAKRLFQVYAFLPAPLWLPRTAH